MTSTSSKEKQPLPMGDTLRDLALLRASDVTLANLLPETDGAARRNVDLDSSVQQSYEFVREARAALRIQDRDDLKRNGEDIGRVREGLEEIVKGLEAS